MVPESDDESDRDRLGRGWSPSPRLRAALFLVVGLLLVSHALVGGLPDALGVTGTVEYDALRVQPDDDRLLFPGAGVEGRPGAGDIAAGGGIDRINCYLDVRDRPACALERALLDGNLTVEDAPEDWNGYTYHGEFYERLLVERADSAELALRPVPAEAVLSNVSVPLGEMPDAVQRAVETGSVRVDPPLSHARRIISTGESYFVLWPAEDVPDSDGPGTVETGLLAVLGAVLVQRGWQRYRER